MMTLKLMRIDEIDDHEDTEICSDAESDAFSSKVIQKVCTTDDIKVICKAGLVQEKVSEKLNEIKRLLYSTKMNGILYNTNVFLQRPSRITVNPFHHLFLEVHKGQSTILIRKTTAVWLFQESERVSSDRLFGVRDKQPFSSDCVACPNVTQQ